MNKFKISWRSIFIFMLLTISVGCKAELKTDINAFDQNGYTPLMNEVRQYYRDRNDSPDRLRRIEKLLKEGADPNLRSRDGRDDSAYTMAFQKPASSRIVRLLIKAGADVNAVNGRGYSVLSGFDEDFETFKYLLDNGLNPNGVISQNSNARFLTFFILVKPNFNAVKLLLEYGADINYQSKKGIGPLKLAISADHISIFTLLLKFGANVENKNLAPLLLKSKKRNDFLALLFENGFDVNETTAKGNTLLHFAYHKLKVDPSIKNTIDFLLENGADPSIRNAKGQKPSDI